MKDSRQNQKHVNHSTPTSLRAVSDLVCEHFRAGVANLSEDEFSALKEAVLKIDSTINHLKKEIICRGEAAKKSIEKQITSDLSLPPAPPLPFDGTTSKSVDLIPARQESSRKAFLHTVIKQTGSGGEGEVSISANQHDSDEVCTSKPEKISNPVNRIRKLSIPFLSNVNELTDELFDDNVSVSKPHPSRKASVRKSLLEPDSARMSMLQPGSRPFKEKVASEKDQWKAVAREAFNIIDENGDGFLQKEEVVAAMKMMEKNGMDFNTDGKEHMELAEQMMREVDLDGDGLIDIDEFIDMMKKGDVAGKGGMESASVFLAYNHRMSQLARNVLLAHQKKIENSVIGNDHWMIHPFSNLHIAWDMIISLLILLTVITMPLTLGWESLNEKFFGMNLMVDILFLIDIVKNFFTGIVDENDAVIMDRKMVARSYLMGFFISDFCGSIPLDLIFRWARLDKNVSAGGAVSGTKNSLKLLRLLRIAKIFRLLRISRLFQHVKDLFLWIEESLNFRISDGFTKLVRLGVGALVLGHWIGCFNFMLVRLHEFPDDSWVVYAGLDDKDPYTQWSWSFFKALAQMIMIGFETPPFTNASCDTASNWCGIEHWITLGCLYVGAVFYSLLISSISSILQTANLASRHFEEKLNQIDDYMRNARLPAAMREKVKDCFHLQHSNGKLFDEGQILDMLTPILKREIKMFTGREITVKVPLLSSVTNKEFAEEMTTILDPVIAFQNEIVIRGQTTGDDMYFIGSGVVEIFLPGAQNIAYVAIGDGCYFGEVSLLLSVRRTASARTKTQCMLYRISKEKLLMVLQDFPDTYASMVRVAESRQRRLRHYMDPDKYRLQPVDEIDAEDCKTELFGVNADKVVLDKEVETSRSRKSHRYTNS